MPLITVFPDVPRAYNRVEINWADTPTVTHARVLRVDVESGTCTPLRPYICFDGDYLLLSCGHGIFWDTEVPLDRSVYYITEGVDAPCLPNTTPRIEDLYTRNLVDTWGSPTVGPAYSVYQGLIGQYDVNGTQGTITPGVIGTNTYALLDAGTTNYTAQIDLPVQTVPTGGNIGVYGMIVRWVDDNNYFRLGISSTPAGVVNVFLTRVLGGATTVTSQVIGLSFANINTVETRVESDMIRVRAWQVGLPKPGTWQIEQAYSDFADSSMIGAAARRDAGNLTPTVLSFDNFTVIDECIPCTPVTATSEPSTMPSNGAFRLKDPVRPCNDIYMPLCFDQSNLASHRNTGQYCAPGTGVFFASMETESYEPNALTVNPTNARRPIAITRQRRDVSSNLTVVSRTFNDRDALLRLAAPGSPILLQGPPQYGIPDRYMDVGTVAVDRGLTDHRFQVRIVQMPHVAVDRPAGPQNGVCGSRVNDLCDFTFDELAAEGNTWEDLVRGRPTGSLLGYRTWNDVLADFADWDDVDNGTRTWTDLEMGD